MKGFDLHARSIWYSSAAEVPYLQRRHDDPGPSHQGSNTLVSREISNANNGIKHNFTSQLYDCKLFRRKIVSRIFYIVLCWLSSEALNYRTDFFIPLVLFWTRNQIVTSPYMYYTNPGR